MATATGTGAGADKRKAETSPGFELSQPRLRRRGLMPDLQETERKKSFSLPDLMRKGFHNPDIVKSIVPNIFLLSLPLSDPDIKKIPITVWCWLAEMAIQIRDSAP